MVTQYVSIINGKKNQYDRFALCEVVIVGALSTGMYKKKKNHLTENESPHLTLEVYYYLLSKGGYVFSTVGLSVSLSVYEQHYSKTYEWI